MRDIYNRKYIAEATREKRYVLRNKNDFKKICSHKNIPI